MIPNGRLDRVLEPGRHRYRRSRVSHQVVDMRPRIPVVNSQEILTSDEVTVRISPIARWRATEPTAFVTAAPTVSKTNGATPVMPSMAIPRGVSTPRPDSDPEDQLMCW